MDDAASVVASAKRAGLDAVFVLSFYDGQTIYPSRIFPRHKEFEGQDPLAEYIKEARAQGLQVFAALETLLWKRPGGSSSAVLLHPERVERNPAGEIVGEWGGDGAFASPAHPRVISLLEQLVLELVRRYELDGVAFDFLRLARGEFLGYSTTSRLAFLRRHSIDALDIDPLGFATGRADRERLAEWLEESVSEAAEKVCSAARRGRPGIKVAIVVEADYYGDRLDNPVRQDWWSWVEKDLADVVICQGLPLGEPRFRNLVERARKQGKPKVLLAIDQAPSAPWRERAEVAGMDGWVVRAGGSRSLLRSFVRELALR
jgi:uncharacterized lipoprotein YddW (UPF0748 family)